MNQREYDSRPNADLRGVVDAARKPTVKFAFDYSELFEEFVKVDTCANRQKTISRIFGFLAVGLVLAALLLASSELLHYETNPETVFLQEIIAAGLGLAGTALGLSGVLHSSNKRQWLCDRLITESMRQFHFQWIVEHFRDIVEAAHDPEKQAAYIRARAEGMKAFKSPLLENTDKMIDAIVEGNLQLLEWSNDPQDHPHDAEMLASAADALDAYGAIRLGYQLDYAEKKIEDRKNGSLFSPRRQEKIFSAIGWICIFVVVAIHLLHFGAHWLHVPPDWLKVGVIWTALVALASRALEDGLQPQREVERYEQYRANCRVSIDRFNKAHSLAQRIEVMRAFESISVEEVRVFVRVHDRSKFVL